MEINFSNKVYSKSLLKVESLKGSVVYSLILNYQFCACVMRVSGVPKLQTIHTECLYSCKWRSTRDACVDWCFADARNLGKSGQSMCHDVTPQLRRKLEGKRSIQGDNFNP